MARYYFELDGSTLPVDDNFITLDVGLPKRSITQTNNISDGATVRGSGAFSGRQIKVSCKFKSANETTRDLILSWFSKSMYKAMYLYKEITGFTGRMQIFGSPESGESYDSYAISKEVSFVMYSKQSHFEKTTQSTLATITVTSTAKQTETVTVAGQAVFPQIQFTPSVNFYTLQIMVSSRWGFRLDRLFSSGDVIIIDMRNGQLSLTINGVAIYSAFDALSSPFLLEKGDNTLDIYATAGTLIIKNYERRL